MAEPITMQKLTDASFDADTLDEFANQDKLVTSRLGAKYPSAPMASRLVVENGLLGATPFSTYTALTASSLVDGDYAVVTNDSLLSNNGFYQKNGGAWQQLKWNPVNLLNSVIIKTDSGINFADESGVVLAEIGSNDSRFYDYLSLIANQSDAITFGDGLFDLLSVSASKTDMGFASMQHINADDVVVMSDDGLFANSILQSTGQQANSSVNDLVDTSSLLFSAKLVGWHDQHIYINTPNLFKQRFAAAKNNDVVTTIYSTSTTLAQPYYETARDLLKIDISKIGSKATLIARRTDSVDRFSCINLDALSVGNGSSAIKVLAIGDSITNRQGVEYIKTSLSSHGYTATFIGTHKGQKNFSDSRTSGTGDWSEGREGWSFADFLHRDTRYAYVSDVASYNALSNIDKRLLYNPFIRPSTGSDNAKNIRNGHVFDIANYLIRFSLDTPDVINIMLGVNDVLRGFTASVYDDCVTMLEQVLAQIPSVKIIISMPAYSVQRNDTWESDAVSAIQSIIKAVKTVNSPRIILAPAWAFCGLDHGYPMTATANQYGVKTGAYDDGLHLQDANRAVLFTTIAAYIAAAHNGV